MKSYCYFAALGLDKCVYVQSLGNPSPPSPLLLPWTCLPTDPATPMPSPVASPSPKVLVLPSPLSPLAKSFSPIGRNKEQRWCDSSPSFPSGGSYTSFVPWRLAWRRKATCHPSVVVAVNQLPLKILLKTLPYHSLMCDKLHDQGWQRVQSHPTRKSLR
jgi:hypothetical protein